MRFGFPILIVALLFLTSGCGGSNTANKGKDVPEPGPVEQTGPLKK